MTEAISAYILHSSGRLNGFMPTAQFNVLQGLHQRVMQSDQDQAARAEWDALSDERDQ